MLNTEHIFNLVKLGKDATYLSALINTSANSAHAPLGSPLVISKKSLADEKTGSIRGIFPFPLRTGHQPGERYSIEKAHLIVKDNGCFVDRNKIKIISEFKADNLDALLKYVKDAGSITFNISAAEHENGILASDREKKTAINVCKFLDTLYNMCSGYKYNSLFFLQYSRDFVSSNISDIYYTVSFLDLCNCIPIFNHKRLDGIGTIFNMSLINSTKTAGSLISKACIALILSNYKDNVFITDGIQVNSIKPINTDVVKVIKNVVMANARLKDRQVEDEDGKAKDTTKWYNTMLHNNNTAATVTHSNATGTSYYYYT